MTTQVAWGDGSGDKITLTYAAAEGTQTVAVSSDPCTGYVTRTKDITFQVTAGGTTISKVLTVVQSGKNITIITRNDLFVTYNDTAVGYETQ